MIWAWHPSLVVDHPLFLEQPSYALQESKVRVWVVDHRLVKDHRLVEDRWDMNPTVEIYT
jgi:hypothetical protein